MDLVKISMIIAFSLSGVFVALYFLFGGTRVYFIFTAFVFLALGMSLLFPSDFMKIAMRVFAVVALIMALVNLVSDTRERIAQMRQEQAEREEAFSDMLAELDKLKGKGNMQDWKL